jgi:iron-sulfur cluster assembly protein
MIELTPAAARRIHLALEDSGEGLGIRVAARRNAQGGIEYALGFDEQREGDVAVQEKGVPLLIGPASRSLLQGVCIDFGEIGAGQSGYLFIAPEASPSSAAPAADAPACAAGACRGCQSRC